MWQQALTAFCFYFTFILVSLMTGDRTSRSNQPPIAVDDSYTIHGLMSPLTPGVTANDFDPDGDPLSIGGVIEPVQHGRLTNLGQGMFSYAADAGYIGADSFRYLICDNQNSCSSAQVMLNVVNQPPNAGTDLFVVHGNTTIGPLLANDSDPDGDAISFGGFVSFPEHGTLQGLAEPDRYSYRPSIGFFGSDFFSYRVCDQYLLCSTASVTVQVDNSPPIATGEEFTTHGITTIGPMLANDSDPDGDQLLYTQLTGASHGTVFGSTTQSDIQSYHPDFGYVGPDSFTYKVCDEFLFCSDPVMVSLNVVNNAPVLGADSYTVTGNKSIGPLRINDYDPDSDPLLEPGIITTPSHGTVEGLLLPDFKFYRPNPGYSGPDSFTYQVCDNLGACSTATVSLLVIGDDAANLGKPCPNSSVGGPINVTNGNMYFSQNDYALPAIGEPLTISRSYNSRSQRTGLFGLGWSSELDESLEISGPTTLRLFTPDGQATSFISSDGHSFNPVEPDFYGQIRSESDGSFTLTTKDGETHSYSSSGKPLSRSDRRGNRLTLSYDSLEHLSSVTDPVGRVVNVTTDGNGNVSKLSDGLGVIATYTYGINRELSAVTYADGSGYQFAYTSSPNLVLTQISDALGDVVESHTYDQVGRALTSARDGGTELVSLNYLEGETVVTDALGHTTTYRFDNQKPRNVVTTVEGHCNCGSASQSQSWTHDQQLNVLSRTNAAGQTTTFTYDESGNQLTTTDVLGTTGITYNPFGQVLTTTDVMGNVSTNEYDGVGNLIRFTDALNNSTRFTFDSAGHVLTVTDGRESVTTFTYDEYGNLKELRDPLGNTTSFSYDLRGRLLSVADALSNVTTYNYDEVGRLTRITRPDNSFITFTYDRAGRRTGMTDPRGNTTNYSFDGSSRLLAITNAVGHYRRYNYDANSNLIAEIDELGRTTAFEYDQFSQLKKVTYPPATDGATPLSQTMNYDVIGNVTSRIDQAGRVTNFEYDDANRVKRVVDPAGQVTQFEYDNRSLTTAVVDAPGQRYGFVYDKLGRLTNVQRAQLTMSFAYDAVGNQVQRRDFKDQLTTYRYDRLHRLRRISYPDESTANYRYDELSRLRAATNAHGRITFDYDNLSRLIRTTDVNGQVVNYTYDANGNRLTMALGNTTDASYAYDELNRVLQISESPTKVNSFSYDAAGRVTGRTLANGVNTLYEYDALNRLTHLRDFRANTVLSDHRYSYDEAGNLLQDTESNSTRAYQYDLLDRLLYAGTTGNTNESYLYDALGNRTGSHLSATYTYNAFNQLAATSFANLTYDANGNLISKNDSAGNTQFAWDFENRLVQVVTPSGQTLNYKYDALGRRIVRSSSRGGVTSFVYDGADIIRDQDSGGTIVHYLNGPGVDNKLRQKGSGESLYYLSDQLGSTRLLTDNRGRIVERLTYDSFGNVQTNYAGSRNTRYDFAGREREAATGLLYYRARWYDPQLGRFISEDPIGLSGGLNQYAYVGNNPLTRKDPSGLYEIDVHYYLTYYLARKHGCFTAEEARLIAEGDQSTDEDPAYSPGARKAPQNSTYHALHPGGHEQYLSDLWGRASSGSGSLEWLGRYLHYLQDTFSHAGFTDPNWGHSPISGVNGNKMGTHATDKTDQDISKAQSMVAATWTAIGQFASKTRCRCQGKWTPDMWGTINEFLIASGGDPIGRRVASINDLDPALLDRKVQILGLPRRY